MKGSKSFMRMHFRKGSSNYWILDLLSDVKDTQQGYNS